MATQTTGRLLSGQELRRLLVLRRRIREEIVGLPRSLQREVLCALDRARQLRLHGKAVAWTPPQMTGAELLREIKWRIDSASLSEAAAGARALDRARRTAAARAKSTAGREQAR